MNPVNTICPFTALILGFINPTRTFPGLTARQKVRMNEVSYYLGSPDCLPIGAPKAQEAKRDVPARYPTRSRRGVACPEREAEDRFLSSSS